MAWASCVVCGINVKYTKNIVSIIILNITAADEYFPGIFFVKFFVPRCSAHMPNISVSENVSRTELNPKKKPDNSVTAIKAAIVCAGR